MTPTSWAEYEAAVLTLEAATLRHALEAEGWSVSGAASRLGITPGGLRRALERRHPRLERERRKRGPGPGRPKSPEMTAE